MIKIPVPKKCCQCCIKGFAIIKAEEFLYNQVGFAIGVCIVLSPFFGRAGAPLVYSTGHLIDTPRSRSRPMLICGTPHSVRSNGRAAPFAR